MLAERFLGACKVKLIRVIKKNAHQFYFQRLAVSWISHMVQKEVRKFQWKTSNNSLLAPLLR